MKTEKLQGTVVLNRGLNTRTKASYSLKLIVGLTSGDVVRWCVKIESESKKVTD